VRLRLGDPRPSRLPVGGTPLSGWTMEKSANQQVGKSAAAAEASAVARPQADFPSPFPLWSAVLSAVTLAKVDSRFPLFRFPPRRFVPFVNFG